MTFSVTQGHRNVTARYSGLLFVETVSPTFIIFAIYELLVDSSSTARVFGVPVGVTPSEFRQYVWHQKTRVLGLPLTLFAR